MLPDSIPGFSDPFSSFSHLFLGAPAFLVLTVILVHRGRGDRGRMIALGLYGMSNVFLFSMSGVYHLLDRESLARHVIQRLDHAAIFFLIAGTYAPVHYILFRGWRRWAPLLVVWTAAILGVTLKSIFFNDLSEFVGLALYLGLGWFGAISGYFIWYFYGGRFFRPLFWGAMAYTFGAVLDFLQGPIIVPGVLGHHELFHLAVLIGATCFCIFVFMIAKGDVPMVERGQEEVWKPDDDNIPRAARSASKG
jgi:channel protein (hemolysin III family)